MSKKHIDGAAAAFAATTQAVARSLPLADLTDFADWMRQSSLADAGPVTPADIEHIRSRAGLPRTPDQDNHDDAYEAFALDNIPLVTRFLAQLCADPSLVEEATQHAFVTARHRWDELARFDRPLAWVRKVALTHLRDKLPRRPDDAPGEISELRLGRPRTPEEAEQIVLRLMRHLTPRERAVFALARHGCSDPEIAWELDLATTTVRAVRAGARRTMADLAEQAGLDGRLA